VGRQARASQRASIEACRKSTTDLSRKVDDGDSERAIADGGFPDLDLARATCDVGQWVRATDGALVEGDEGLHTREEGQRQDPGRAATLLAHFVAKNAERQVVELCQVVAHDERRFHQGCRRRR
jgi:hypothetical protein